MKKLFYSAAILFAAAAALASCAKEALPEKQENKISENNGLVFTAYISDEDTKTTYDSVTHHINWEDGDEVSINGVVFTATKDADNPRKATFTKKNESDPAPTAPYTAYYPASIYSNGSPMLPSSQNYTADASFAKVNPMYAESSTLDLDFKNLCGILELTLKSAETPKVTSIHVSDDNLGMSGTFTMDAGKAVVASKQGVTLDCGASGVVLSETGTKFYVAIPAGDYTKLNVRVCTSDGMVFEKVAINTANVERNKIYSIPEWTPSFTTPDYLCITALKAGAQITLKASGTITSVYEYSTDGSTWYDITFNTPFATLGSVGEKVYIKLKAESRAEPQATNNYIKFYATEYIEVSGNVMYLLSSSGTASLSEGGYDFRGLFTGCENLVKADRLVLPAMSLTKFCCYYMFYKCSSLTAAPALPATSLADQCYSNMFNSCTALTTAPALPAMSLENQCYVNMFYGCESLTAAPALPATTLTSSCYKSMFYGCKSLTAAPDLPATSLATNCYETMFKNCTALTTASALPAETLVNHCYRSMFSDCTLLTTAPALPATTLVEACYYEMFVRCASLTTAPVLPATKLIKECYRSMFDGCKNLTSITCLATDINATDCTKNWVRGISATGTFTIESAAMETFWAVRDAGSGKPESFTYAYAH